MKKCPNCNRDLTDAAIKCKYCDYRFSSANTPIPETQQEDVSSRSITDKSQVLTQTKKCRHCAMEIPMEASVCPFCRKSTSKLIVAGDSMIDTGKKITTLVISLIVIAVVIFCLISLLK